MKINYTYFIHKNIVYKIVYNASEILYNKIYYGRGV